MIGILFFGSLSVLGLVVAWRLLDEVERLGRLVEKDVSIYERDCG